MLKLRIYNAGEGDCLAIREGRRTKLIFDTGMPGSHYAREDSRAESRGFGLALYDAVGPRSRRSGKRKPPVVVISHIDNDHVGGLKAWVEDNRDDRNAISRFMLRKGLGISEFINDVTGNEPTVLKPAVPKDRFVSPEEQQQRDQLQFVQQQRQAGKNEGEIGELMREQNSLLKQTVDAIQQQAAGQQATQDLLRDSIRTPTNVNVRVQAPATDSPRGTGAASLGVQGG